MMTNSRVYSTGQVAKICKVATRTVKKWCDSGRLRHSRVGDDPKGDRQIQKGDLINFLKEHDIELPDELRDDVIRVLVVTQDEAFTEGLKGEMTPEGSFMLKVVADSFDAGWGADEIRPECIIVDYSIGRVEAQKICELARKKAELPGVILLAVLPEHDDPDSFSRPDVNQTFNKPVDVEMLTERVRTLVGQKKEPA